ncbi:RNA polymerase sigma factor [Nocardia nepalensis]|uniref:RNA polymerase sigma factor n=1 Tax=Nocardia nepalensis TaxID=3375448 RepID=UPI003B6736E1
MQGRASSARTADARTGRELRVVSEDTYTDWHAVYQDNVAWVYGLMFAKVGNRADAEDLTGEVFLAALRPLRISASIPQVRAYLRATARSVLAEHWRKRLGCEITSIDDDVSQAEAPDPELTDAPERARAMLEQLPERYRRILELRFLQGCSVREAAVELGISLVNARVLQHRALRMAAQLERKPR